MAVAGPIGAVELQRHLLARADGLRRYVAAKIPAPLAGVLSADDILQETFVAAFRHVRSFVPDGPDALDRWLITIVNRKLIDAFKAAQRLKRGGQGLVFRDERGRSLSLAGLLARFAAPRGTPSREVSVREAADAVQKALGRLRPDRRQAIMMRFIDGLALRQIAGRMGKSSAAVNSLLFHGLRELRSRLGRATRFFSDARSADAQPAPTNKAQHS